MGAIPRSEFIWLAIFNYINYYAFEKTASEHQCNILLKSRGESNKGLVSLEQTISNTPIQRARFTQKCSGLFQEESLTAQIGPFFGISRAAPTVLCSSLRHCQDRLMRHLPELGAAGMKHDKPEGWGHVCCVQVTLSSEEAQGGCCSNLSFRRSHETS